MGDCATVRYANLRYADEHYAELGNLVDPDIHNSNPGVFKGPRLRIQVRSRFKVVEKLTRVQPEAVLPSPVVATIRSSANQPSGPTLALSSLGA